MFLNYKILQERLKSTMTRYGIKEMDNEIMYMISDSMKNKYTEMIKELI